MTASLLRTGLFLAGLAGLLATAAAQGAEAYPDKPVTLVVPTAAAGGTDTIARLVADALGKSLKQPFVVDNRPGANGILGTEQVARAAPDGYRLLFTYAAAMVVNPSLYRKLPYDPVKDFAPVAQIGRGGNLLLVRNDLPVKTLADFVAYAKARPDKLSYCSWGNGSGGHLAMESLKKQAGLVIEHVPYKGSGPCVQDLMGGQVEAAFADMSSTVELVRAGRLRALANSGPSRIPMLPEVPTMTESGYPFTTYAWYGVLAPAKTPPAIVKKLNEAVNRALRDPAVVQRLRELNFTDLPQNTPEQFAATLRQDLRDWGALVKDIGLQPE
ncbi:MULTISPECIES: tripartite tricarboxylate transporter substrate binding protein [unclassified Variovorax]|jgi:tripartite-type tricarboxylate transporter receptor subunit TctC|uniref:Bug family tripartite tricarboxylate transporter substrate binding protein n=1 Tax=unclassified Variovorax TaxID=663243 RepID=UPI000C484859|nr:MULTISPECIES: tripartite tricarboxylate transporter substrate binding protein [unclassified Variovorax]MBS75700.1 ABC transporter substrate-binding protein [Variovorax sp.]MCT8176897.1 tripartite tricarboxylate transporter substrate binding protein [Variovorax sp. CY25R-8]